MGLARRPDRLSPGRRRVVYAVSYEALGTLISAIGLAAFSGTGFVHAGGLAVVTSLIALGWNVGFNAVFEWWESRQPVRGRSVGRRLAHATLFEIGLTALLIPVIALWLDVSVVTAFLYDAGLIAFFFVYTLVFNWTFDLIFGLPASAR